MPYKAKPIAQGGLPAEYPSQMGRGQAQVFAPFNPLPLAQIQAEKKAQRQAEEAKVKEGIDMPGVFFSHVPPFEEEAAKIKEKANENPEWVNSAEGKQRIYELKQAAIASKNIGKNIMARGVSVTKGKWEGTEALDELTSTEWASQVAREKGLFGLISASAEKLRTVKEKPKPTNYWKKIQSVKPSLKGTKIEKGEVTITDKGANEAANAKRAITTFNYLLTPIEQQQMVDITGSKEKAIKTIEDDLNLRATIFKGRAEDEPKTSGTYGRSGSIWDTGRIKATLATEKIPELKISRNLLLPIPVELSEGERRVVELSTYSGETKTGRFIKISQPGFPNNQILVRPLKIVEDNKGDWHLLIEAHDFLATNKFIKDNPDYKLGETVIGKAQSFIDLTDKVKGKLKTWSAKSGKTEYAFDFDKFISGREESTNETEERLDPKTNKIAIFDKKTKKFLRWK